MARFIPVDGTESLVQPAQGERFLVPELEQLIGANQVDTINLAGGNVMIIAHDGRLFNLPVNHSANAIVQADPEGVVYHDQPVVGPVVILAPDEFPALASSLRAYYG